MVAGPSRAPRTAADLVVIGAGVIGLACAWRALGAGATVTIVDPSPGGGATRAAAGMLAAVTEAHFGEEGILDLNLRSAASWPAFADELEKETGVEVGYDASGTLAVAFDPSDKVALDDLHRFHAELGLASNPVSGLAARRLEPLLAPGVRGGLDVPGDHQVDPRRTARALLAACVAHGAELLEDSVGEVIVETGRCAGVRTTGGVESRGGQTLIASGWQAGRLAGLPPGSVPAVRPVKGQILRLEMPPELPSPTRTIRGLVHGQGIYVVPRRDREVVVGATVEERGDDAAVTAGAVYVLLRDAQAILPVLAEAALAEASVGFRPGTPDNAPFIGRSGLDGLLVATGHFRNGILLAPVTAELVVAMLASPRAELPPWAAPFDPRRPGASAPMTASA